jgi:hypothetical protein
MSSSSFREELVDGVSWPMPVKMEDEAKDREESIPVDGVAWPLPVRGDDEAKDGETSISDDYSNV